MARTRVQGQRESALFAGSHQLLPALLVAIVLKEIAGDSPTRVVLKSQLDVMRAGGIDGAEESVGRLRFQANFVSGGTLFKELVALTEDRFDSVPVWLAVVAGQAVELRRWKA